MKLKIFILILAVFPGFIWCSDQLFAKTSSSTPLVLQMEISHPRNIDQTSLIFRKKTVDFVTNSFQISSKQESPKVRLGQFTTVLNDNFKSLQKKIKSIKKRLISKNKKGNTKNMKGSIQMGPHTPVIRIGGEGSYMTIQEKDTHFESLRNILRKAENRKWNCISCAEYKKDGQSIIRVVRKKGDKAISRTFSRKSLKCISIDKDRIECIDPQFGIFEL